MSMTIVRVRDWALSGAFKMLCEPGRYTRLVLTHRSLTTMLRANLACSVLTPCRVSNKFMDLVYKTDLS